MSTTKELLKNMNPGGLFETRQPSILHDIFVVGKPITVLTNPKEAEGKDNPKIKKIIYIQTSEPNETAIKAGVKKSEFIHATVKPTGTIKIDEDSGEETFSGPKKSQLNMIFQTAQPDLFNFIAKAIAAGEYDAEKNPTGGYTSNGEVVVTDAKNKKQYKRPQIKLRKKMFGRIIAMNVPEFEPHSMGLDGKFYKLSPVTLNPVTGQYVATPVVKGSIRFFADDDDLDLLIDAAAKIVDKQVRPWVKDKKTLVVEDSFGNTKIKVDEANLHDDEPLTNETQPENDDDDEKN